MLNRLDFYDLQDNLREINIDISDVTQKAEEFITCINSINYNSNTLNKIRMIRNAESLVKDILQFLVININPDLNRLIELDQKENDSHKSFIICMGLIQNKIEEQKKNLINNMHNKEVYDANRITNRLNIDFYSSYLESLVENLILKTLKISFFKFWTTEDPVTDSENYLKNIIKNFESVKTKYLAKIPKDSNLFWYLVFSNLFRSSQVVGFMQENQLKINKPFEIKDLKRLVRVEIESEKLKKEEEKNKEGQKVDEKPKSEETGSEEEPEDDLDGEELDDEEVEDVF